MKNTYYNNYIFLSETAGPILEPTMKVTIISSRDTDQNIVFTLSFNVTFGPPSRVLCSYNNQKFIAVRGNHLNLLREVIRSRYTSSQPDMTRITVMVDQPIREGRTYRCEVFVEGREGIVNGTYTYLPMGPPALNSSTNVTISGE